MEIAWWWLVVTGVLAGAGGFAVAWKLGLVRMAKAVQSIEAKTKARAEHLAMRATRRLREENTRLNAKLEEQAQEIAEREARLSDEHAHEMQALAKQLIEAHDVAARSSATPSQVRAFAPTTTEEPRMPSRRDTGDGTGFAATTIDERR